MIHMLHRSVCAQAIADASSTLREDGRADALA